MLDRAGNIRVAANERNRDRRRGAERARDRVLPHPLDPTSGLRNGGPLETPTSPTFLGRTLCVTQSDGNRHDNSPNTAGEATPGSAVVAKVSCLDEPLPIPGMPLPIRWTGAFTGRLPRGLLPVCRGAVSFPQSIAAGDRSAKEITMKASILTLVAAAALCSAQLAQAHILLGSEAAVASTAASAKSSLAVMTAAGIRYHAAANYRNERLYGGSSKPVRPDDRPGPRGV